MPFYHFKRPFLNQKAFETSLNEWQAYKEGSASKMMVLFLLSYISDLMTHKWMYSIKTNGHKFVQDLQIIVKANNQMFVSTFRKNIKIHKMAIILS